MPSTAPSPAGPHDEEEVLGRQAQDVDREAGTDGAEHPDQARADPQVGEAPGDGLVRGATKVTPSRIWLNSSWTARPAAWPADARTLRSGRNVRQRDDRHAPRPRT